VLLGSGARFAATSPDAFLRSKIMAMNPVFTETEPKRVEVDAWEGPVLLEFGAPGCGHCRAAQPLLETALARHPGVRHVKIEDGRGRRLGRSFAVKLWPTLVFLKHGKEVARLVRPSDAGAISRALAQFDAAH
jgi:thioredoxin 1